MVPSSLVSVLMSAPTLDVTVPQSSHQRFIADLGIDVVSDSPCGSILLPETDIDRHVGLSEGEAVPVAEYLSRYSKVAGIKVPWFINYRGSLARAKHAGFEFAAAEYQLDLNSATSQIQSDLAELAYFCQCCLNDYGLMPMPCFRFSEIVDVSGMRFLLDCIEHFGHLLDDAAFPTNSLIFACTMLEQPTASMSVDEANYALMFPYLRHGCVKALMRRSSPEQTLPLISGFSTYLRERIHWQDKREYRLSIFSGPPNDVLLAARNPLEAHAKIRLREFAVQASAI